MDLYWQVPLAKTDSRSLVKCRVNDEAVAFFRSTGSAREHQSWALLFHFKWLTDPVRVGIKRLTAVHKVGLVRERKNRVLSVVKARSCKSPMRAHFQAVSPQKGKTPQTKTDALSSSHIDTVCSRWTYNRVADATANGDFVHTEELGCDSGLNECRSAIVCAALCESYQAGCLPAFIYHEASEINGPLP